MGNYNIKNNFGKVLRELRTSKGLTQEQLAESLDLQAYQTINLIENGKSFVTSDLLEKMCDFFKVSPAIFFINNNNFSQKDNEEYLKEIKFLLPTLPPNRLKDIYNIILSFLK